MNLYEAIHLYATFHLLRSAGWLPLSLFNTPFGEILFSLLVMHIGLQYVKSHEDIEFHSVNVKNITICLMAVIVAAGEICLHIWSSKMRFQNAKLNRRRVVSRQDLMARMDAMLKDDGENQTCWTTIEAGPTKLERLDVRKGA
jgi:hypothetical protein